MFEWLKKQYIEKLVSRVRSYVQENYTEPAKTEEPKPASQEPKVQHSRRDDIPSSGNVQFQKWVSEEDQLKEERDRYNLERIITAMEERPGTPTYKILRDLDLSINMTFVDKLLDHIDKRHMRDADVYRAAQVDRRLFSKIASDRWYKPSKDTCIAFALALKLTLDEAEDLLSRAGYTLSHSSKRDVMIEYFFREHIYNLNDINTVLYELEQKVIGR